MSSTEATSSGVVGFLQKCMTPFTSLASVVSGKKNDDDDGGSLALLLLKNFKNLDIEKMHHVLEFVANTVKNLPVDDRPLAMHTLMEIAAKLPEGSTIRTKITNILIKGLWDSLEHPPMSFHGAQYQYRTADGSYNNPHFPELGRARTHYAKSIQRQTPMPGARPDPGLLFDLLMKRQPGKFKPQQSGISSLFFAHAALIIHDIFRTNRKDRSINNNSSYLDLSTLYGTSIEEQMKVRAMQGGLLKPDTFHDERLLGQSLAPNVLLVLYNRMHNYVAEMLLKINEGGRFSCAPNDEQGAVKQDEDLFQTARLIVGGLFMNICLHDYLRAINNIHHSESTWTLDPRVDMPDTIMKDGTDRGVGNQVSTEFNLLYRFHSSISERDEEWLNEFFQGMFKESGKTLDQVTPRDAGIAMASFEKGIPDDPSTRDIQGLKRGPDGKFKDEDLVRVLKQAIDDPAGAFGARNVPAGLRVIEISGIMQSREWQTASLNEMRKYFKLKTHDTFEEINPDPEIADILRNLYGHPDNVEAYPGIFVEDCAYRVDPGSGICAPFTVERAILSDAITLIRSDRFYTTEYNIGTLTSWGMAEVAQDYKTLGGSMFYKLIQRTVPGWFPFNSLHVMQPMYTKDMNLQIAKDLGQTSLYTTEDPSPPPHLVPVGKHSTLRKVMEDPKRFAIPWGKPFDYLIEGRRADQYMLAGDGPYNREQRNSYGKALLGSGELMKTLPGFLTETTEKYLKSGMRPITDKIYQIDVIKDLAIPVMSKLMSDMFLLDLKTDENPNGSYNSHDLYADLMALNAWGLNNTDKALSWNRRREAKEAMEKLVATTEPHVKNTSGPGFIRSLFQGNSASDEDSLRSLGGKAVAELLENGRPFDEVVDIMIYSALGGVGSSMTMITDILHYLLVDDKSSTHLAAVRARVHQNTKKAENELRRYGLEIQRLVSHKKSMRVATTACEVDNLSFKPGDYAICDYSAAQMDPEAFPEPEKIKLDRPLKNYTAFSLGPHECFSREIGTSFVTEIVKRVSILPDIRPAPGDMGVLKRVFVGHAPNYLSEDWSTLAADPTTWKLHFDAKGSGLL